VEEPMPGNPHFYLNKMYVLPIIVTTILILGKIVE